MCHTCRRYRDDDRHEVPATSWCPVWGGWSRGRIWEAGESPAQARCGDPTREGSVSPKTGLVHDKFAG